MVDKRELRWFGHLIRMDSNKKPRQVWDARVQGMWGRGRPRIKWEELVWKVTKKGKTLQEVTGLMKDREAIQILLMKTDTWKGDNRLGGGGQLCNVEGFCCGNLYKEGIL